MNCVSANVDWIKVYEIQNKNGIMMNFDVSVNHEMIRVLVKLIVHGILGRVIASVIRHVKFGKLVFACDDEVLYTTET